jgi:hypothetical protein
MFLRGPDRTAKPLQFLVALPWSVRYCTSKNRDKMGHPPSPIGPSQGHTPKSDPSVSTQYMPRHRLPLAGLLNRRYRSLIAQARILYPYCWHKGNSPNHRWLRYEARVSSECYPSTSTEAGTALPMIAPRPSAVSFDRDLAHVVVQIAHRCCSHTTPVPPNSVGGHPSQRSTVAILSLPKAFSLQDASYTRQGTFHPSSRTRQHALPLVKVFMNPVSAPQPRRKSL